MSVDCAIYNGTSADSKSLPSQPIDMPKPVRPDPCEKGNSLWGTDDMIQLGGNLLDYGAPAVQFMFPETYTAKIFEAIGVTSSIIKASHGDKSGLAGEGVSAAASNGAERAGLSKAASSRWGVFLGQVGEYSFGRSNEK